MIKNIIIFLLLAVTFGCKSEFKIEPIDQEFNTQLLTLKGLDKRLFSTKQKLQYFEISGHNGVTPPDIQAKLIDFIHQNYSTATLEKPAQFTFLFYDKSLTNNYKRHIYEAARDTESGMIDEFKADLVAQIRFFKSAKAQTQHIIIYDGEDQLLNTVDTLSRIKEGKIANVTIAAVKPLAMVSNNNCLTIEHSDKKLAFASCYELAYIQIRGESEDKLSLTFINGKSAMDVDFYPAGGDWLSKTVTFFGQTTELRKGKTLKLKISLKEFNYATIAETFLKN